MSQKTKNILLQVLHRRATSARSAKSGFLKGNLAEVVIQGLSVTIIAAFLVAAIIYAWQEPTAPPPGGNVAAPINTGSDYQLKTGPLTISSQFITATSTFLASRGGNVGIGTTNPGFKFHVNVGSGDNWLAAFQSGTDAAGNRQELLLGYNSVGDYAVIQGHHANVKWADVILQRHGGNVGIGTTEPGTKLHVAGAIKYDRGSFSQPVTVGENGWLRDAWLTAQGSTNIWWDDATKKWRRGGSTDPGTCYGYNDFGGILHYSDHLAFIKGGCGPTKEWSDTDFRNNFIKMTIDSNGILDMRSGGIRLGGVTRTSWPGGGGSCYWTDYPPSGCEITCPEGYFVRGVRTKLSTYDSKHCHPVKLYCCAL